MNMKRMIALAAAFGLIMAGAVSVTAAALPTETDQVAVKKPMLNAGAQQFRDAMKWHRSNIQPQKP
jgi:hypothetical protein